MERSLEKMRLDALLTEKGLAPSREKAKALIREGQVFVDGKRAEKPGAVVAAECEPEIRGGLRYVSRGGLKLEKAIRLYELNLAGKICMDVGASTGGFTDCMLQNGAARVYAVDVGTDQLAASLRANPRVVNMEQTNIRTVTPEQVVPLDFVSVDVSFISLALVLPVVRTLLKTDGQALCLVKPQFEAGRGHVGKNGVVRELATHLEVCRKIRALLPDCGFGLLGATFSPIKGPQGNIEYLYLLGSPDCGLLDREAVEEMVRRSHRELDRTPEEREETECGSC